MVAYAVQLKQVVGYDSEPPDLHVSAELFLQFPRQCLDGVLAVLHTSAGHEAEAVPEVVFDKEASIMKGDAADAVHEGDLPV